MKQYRRETMLGLALGLTVAMLLIVALHPDAVAQQFFLLRDIYVEHETTGDVCEVDASSPKQIKAVAKSTIDAADFGSGAAAASLYLKTDGATGASWAAIDDVYLLNTGDVGTGVYDFGGATSFEIPNSASLPVVADGQLYLEIDEAQIVIQTGSVGAGLIPAATDIAIPLIHQKDITIVEPDVVQAVTDAIPIFTVDSYNYPAGIKITAIRIAASSAVTLTYNLEEWISPTDGAPATIDALALIAATEATETTITDGDVAVGGYVFVDLDTTNVNWVMITVWFYVKD